MSECRCESLAQVHVTWSLERCDGRRQEGERSTSQRDQCSNVPTPIVADAHELLPGLDQHRRSATDAHRSRLRDRTAVDRVTQPFKYQLKGARVARRPISTPITSTHSEMIVGPMMVRTREATVGSPVNAWTSPAATEPRPANAAIHPSHRG